jgi:hypothetical protein
MKTSRTNKGFKSDRPAILIAGVLIVVGLAIGLYGASKPTASQVTESNDVLLKTVIAIDPNDYATQNLLMIKGQSVNFTLDLDNDTIFTFDVMNQSQYYIYYGCAPRCAQPLLGGNGSYYQQEGETTPYFVNATVSGFTPYVGKFTAPANGTYYFVFDNSIGENWAQYLGHNATGSTVGNFTMATVATGNSYSLNWSEVGPGIGVMIVGGAVPLFLWRPKKLTK